MIKGKYIDDILSGRKKATIRLGKWRPKFDEVIFHGGGRPFAIAKITKVEYKKVNELTEEDAKMDGFGSLKELLSDLKKVYPNLREDDYVTIIHFEVLKKLTEVDREDPYMGLSPVDVARLALRYLDDLTDEEKKVFKLLTEVGSLREASIRLYGNISKRWIIRKKLKRALMRMIEKGLIGPNR